MSIKGSRVTVRVPASTSNCGAGFDTLGLALNLYNTVVVDATGSSAGAMAGDVSSARASDMVATVLDAYSAAGGELPKGFTYQISGDVPPARGLGSSITVIGGILMALDALSDSPLGREKLVAIATAIEGHPDNASAGLLGGFCVARCRPEDNAYAGTVRIEIPDTVVFVAVSPESEMLTKEARGVLPKTLPYFDAVKSINSAAQVVAAFATGNYESLRGAVSDFMHEPYRLPRIKGGAEAIAAGNAAGAYTGWLSGSGSTVLCVASRETSAAVESAMRGAFAAVGVKSSARILTADNIGAVVVD